VLADRPMIREFIITSVWVIRHLSDAGINER
jgi:hypothetical protein